LYTIKIHGSGSSNSFFGFQFASVSGSGASQIQAGTASALPSGVASHSLSGLAFIEQTHALSATSAGVYDVSFQWTAPSTAVSTITLYCTLNAVNGDGSANTPDVSGNTQFSLPLMPGLSVGSVAGNIAVTAFPNPVSNNLNVTLENAKPGAYALQAFDLSGKCVTNDQIEVSGSSHTASLNTASWAPGMYQVVISKDGANKVVPVVKQ
jgi:hypothetical protein